MRDMWILDAYLNVMIHLNKDEYLTFFMLLHNINWWKTNHCTTIIHISTYSNIQPCQTIQHVINCICVLGFGPILLEHKLPSFWTTIANHKDCQTFRHHLPHKSIFIYDWEKIPHNAHMGTVRGRQGQHFCVE